MTVFRNPTGEDVPHMNVGDILEFDEDDCCEKCGNQRWEIVSIHNRPDTSIVTFVERCTECGAEIPTDSMHDYS